MRVLIEQVKGGFLALLTVAALGFFIHLKKALSDDEPCPKDEKTSVNIKMVELIKEELHQWVSY